VSQILRDYMLDRFRPSLVETIATHRLMRADSAVQGAFSVSAGYSVGDTARWRAAALDAAQAVIGEIRYLFDDIRGCRADGSLTPGEIVHLLDVAGTLRARATYLRTAGAVA